MLAATLLYFQSSRQWTGMLETRPDSLAGRSLAGNVAGVFGVQSLAVLPGGRPCCLPWEGTCVGAGACVGLGALRG